MHKMIVLLLASCCYYLGAIFLICQLLFILKAKELPFSFLSVFNISPLSTFFRKKVNQLLFIFKIRALNEKKISIETCTHVISRQLLVEGGRAWRGGLNDLNYSFF